MASSCHRCGTHDDRDADDDGISLGWSLAQGADGPERLCDRCTRDHVRDIEAKLDESWWGGQP